MDYGTIDFILYIESRIAGFKLHSTSDSAVTHPRTLEHCIFGAFLRLFYVFHKGKTIFERL